MRAEVHNLSGDPLGRQLVLAWARRPFSPLPRGALLDYLEQNGVHDAGLCHIEEYITWVVNPHRKSSRWARQQWIRRFFKPTLADWFGIHEILFTSGPDTPSGEANSMGQ